MEINILLKNEWPEWYVVKEIGEGAYGIVYHIRKEEFGHSFDAALKRISVPKDRSELNVIRAELSDSETVTDYFQSIVSEFVNEFVLMEKLKGYTHIVSYEDHKVIPHKEDEGWEILIRMELLTSFSDYMVDHKITEDMVIKLGTDMCEALEVCHRQHIIHRDIKPQNIFLTTEGEFKLGDFGVARTLEKSLSVHSKRGTYTYMAPEVYKGEAYDKTVDIYSLGILMYRLMNDNRDPYIPDGEKITYKTREKALNDRMSGKENMALPVHGNKGLQDAIMKACSFSQDDRYQSAEEMRMALQSLSPYKEETKPETVHEKEDVDLVSISKEVTGQEDIKKGFVNKIDTGGDLSKDLPEFENPKTADIEHVGYLSLSPEEIDKTVSAFEQIKDPYDASQLADITGQTIEFFTEKPDTGRDVSSAPPEVESPQKSEIAYAGHPSLSAEEIDKTVSAFEDIRHPNDAKQLLGISFGWDCISVAYPSERGIISVKIQGESLTEPAVFSMTEDGKLLIVNDEQNFRKKYPRAPVCYLGELILDESKKMVYKRNWFSGYQIIKKYCEYIRLKVNQVFGKLTGTCVITLPTKDLNIWFKWKEHLTNAGFYLRGIMYQASAVCFYDYWKNGISYEYGEILYCTLDGKHLELCAPVMGDGKIENIIVSDHLHDDEEVSQCYKRLIKQLIIKRYITLSKVREYKILCNNNYADNLEKHLIKLVKGQGKVSYSLCEQAAKGCAVQGGKIQGITSYGKVQLLDSLFHDVAIKYHGTDKTCPQFLTIFEYGRQVPAIEEKEIVLNDYLNQFKEMEFYYSTDIKSNLFPTRKLGFRRFDKKRTTENQLTTIRFSAENNMDIYSREIDSLKTSRTPKK